MLVRGGRQQVAHGAAVGDETKVDGASQVGIGGIVRHVHGEENLTGLAELFIRKLAVVRHDHASDIGLACFRDRQAVPA